MQWRSLGKIFGSDIARLRRIGVCRRRAQGTGMPKCRFGSNKLRHVHVLKPEPFGFGSAPGEGATVGVAVIAHAAKFSRWGFLVDGPVLGKKHDRFGFFWS